MSGDLILAIDNGTQSVRALVFDAGGSLLAKSQVKLDRYERPEPGWMEHDAEGFWRSFCEACRNLWATGLVAPAQIRGTVVTTQRATVVSLGRDGRPLRPAIIWADQRRANASANLGWGHEALFAALGIRETVRAFERDGECNWIAQNEPHVHSATEKYLLLSGYLNYRLTGRFVDAIGSQVGYIPFDYRSFKWAADGDWKWRCLAVRRDMLPELAPSGSRIGSVTEEAAEATGLPQDLPVIAGASDKACEVIGSGALTPDIAAISCGTTATINITSDRYVEPSPFVPPYPAAIPGRYNAEVQVTRGFWMVSWFAEQFGFLERERAAQANAAPEAYFDDLIRATRPGSGGLMLQPFWNPGVRLPGPEARGGVIGFTDSHTRADFYRAIIEGLAYALREGKERIEKRSGVPIRRLRIAGGGSQSDAVMQIMADIFNLTAERPAHYEASGLGAAILASVGLGLHRNFEDAVAAMTLVGRAFTPIPENARLYEQLYAGVYRKMYGRLRPLYRSLKAISDDETAKPH